MGETSEHLKRYYEPAWFQALGEFVEAYAMFEQALFFYTCALARINRDVGAALLSGTNVEGKIGLIRRIWRIESDRHDETEFIPPDADSQRELGEVFEQVLNITTLRNLILHYGSYFTEDGTRKVSDSTRALVRRLARTHQVDTALLGDLKEDILKCSAHLSHAGISLRPWNEGLKTKRGGRQLDAWRYKRPPGQPQSVRKREPKRGKK